MIPRLHAARPDRDSSITLSRFLSFFLVFFAPFEDRRMTRQRQHRVANPWALVSNLIYMMTRLYWGTNPEWCSLGVPCWQSRPNPLFQDPHPIKYLFVRVFLSMWVSAHRFSTFEVANPPLLDRISRHACFRSSPGSIHNLFFQYNFDHPINFYYCFISILDFWEHEVFLSHMPTFMNVYCAFRWRTHPRGSCRRPGEPGHCVRRDGTAASGRAGCPWVCVISNS